MSRFTHLLTRSTKSARETFVRFPASIMAAIIVTGIFLYLSRDMSGNFDSSQPVLRVAVVGVYFVFMSVAITLLSESYGWVRLKWVLLTALLADSVIYYFLFPENLETGAAFHMMRWLVIVFATFILIFVIPFFRKGLNAQQFWQFFWELASRLVVTVVFGFVLWGGVSLAVAAFDFLFGFDVDEEWYLRIWMMVVGVFGPWFYLAGFPREFASKEQVSFPRLLRILTMYIGTPIVGIYLIILYAYSLKILSTQQWPEGQVVWLMLAFLLIGFAVILFSYALQYTEKHPIYSRLQRGFFIAILPLMIVYFMSISIRIGEYGWTDNRYIVTAFGVWIVLSSVAYLVFRRDIRWIFGLFVVIASLSVLTPWINMFDVGIRSQEARLNAFFEEQGMISPEGKIMRFDEVQKIDYSFYSIVQYLHSRDALDGFLARLQEPFDTEGLERWELEDALVRALNIDAGYPRAGFRHLNIQQLRGSGVYDLSGYSKMMRFADWTNDDPENEQQVTALERGAYLEVQNGSVTHQIDMHTVAKSLLDTDAQPTMYEGVFDEGVSYRMIFDHMNGQYETQTGEWTYLNYSGWLLIQ